jgi:hypothetical protein
MQAGDALCYDYRLVHGAAPNDSVAMLPPASTRGTTRSRAPLDAHHEDPPSILPGERPILQLVYTVKGYDEIGSNYGYFELFA